MIITDTGIKLFFVTLFSLALFTMAELGGGNECELSNKPNDANNSLCESSECATTVNDCEIFNLREKSGK